MILGLASHAFGRPVNVVVWDEQQPAQKQAYTNFLGNRIADYLRLQPGLNVTSVNINQPCQGLTSELLNQCDVLVWWGHVRNGEIKPETAKPVVDRVLSGKMAFVALHSAHWSEPFVQLMRARAIADAKRQFHVQESEIELVLPERFLAPKRDEPLTPKVIPIEGSKRIKLMLPNCCFPGFRADGAPSHVTTLLPKHPVARGIPLNFDIPQTEMYDEPFHAPPPDQTVFEERWDKGEHFRSGLVWKVGKGRVFYFRPGHETYPVYQQEEPLRIIANAVNWLGGR